MTIRTFQWAGEHLDYDFTRDELRSGDVTIGDHRFEDEVVKRMALWCVPVGRWTLWLRLHQRWISFQWQRNNWWSPFWSRHLKTVTTVFSSRHHSVFTGALERNISRYNFKTVSTVISSRHHGVHRPTGTHHGTCLCSMPWHGDGTYILAMPDHVKIQPHQELKSKLNSKVNPA